LSYQDWDAIESFIVQLTALAPILIAMLIPLLRYLKTRVVQKWCNINYGVKETLTKSFDKLHHKGGLGTDER
jgi:hypothetical protein